MSLLLPMDSSNLHILSLFLVMGYDLSLLLLLPTES